MDLEIVAMQLVGNAGESKSLCFEALKAAKQGDFEEAEAKIAEAKKLFIKAHEIQTDLICQEVEGNEVKMGVLMVHAQDHLMTSLLARDLIEEMIDLYKMLKTK